MLLGAHLPGVDTAAPGIMTALMSAAAGLGSLDVLRGWHGVMCQVYACGSACIVMEVDRAAAESCKETPLLQLMLGSQVVETDHWFEFTNAMADDVDTAYAHAKPWHCHGELLEVQIPAEDVETVFKALPNQCKARVVRGNRQCRNRGARGTGDRCYCHTDRNKFLDWI